MVDLLVSPTEGCWQAGWSDLICGRVTFTSAGRSELLNSIGDEGPEAGTDQVCGVVHNMETF